MYITETAWKRCDLPGACAMSCVACSDTSIKLLTRTSCLVQAFCYSNAVLTCSFHHHAPLFFPGSGSLADQGGHGGKEALINVPLLEGCRYRLPATVHLPGAGARLPNAIHLECPSHCWDVCSDENFLEVFRHAIRGAAASFAPNVVVLQCGADALVGDPLGEFNLTQKGHLHSVSA